MIGKKIGRFEVRQWISGGRFADVFLVYDPLTDQVYALKLARRRTRHQEFLKHEARILASLQHENIVRFYFADFYEDRLYMVLEYVEGRSLRALLQEQKVLPADEALRILSEALQGLAYAHRRGILHRDLKPENLLLSREGTVKLADFGLALLFQEDLGLAGPGGTPLYMAPEAWEGKVTKATDVWALGAVFYEMLTGEPPFSGDTLEEIRSRIRAGTLSTPKGMRPEFFRLIKQALHPDPARRLPDASAFLAAVRQLQSQRTFTAQPVLHLEGSASHLFGGLTEEQATVVREADGPALVIGGPGTGKTRTLIARVVYLVEEQGVPPEEILVVTFAHRGVQEIRERLTEALGRDRAGMVAIGTYHYLALQILAYGGDRLGLPEHFSVASSRTQEEILGRLLGTTSPLRVRPVLKAIAGLKRQFVEPEEARLMARSRWQRTVADLYGRYQEALQREGLLDFDDLLLYTHRLLTEHPEVREELASRFRYVIADEFQDINEAQYLLLKTLASGHGNLLVFGDDDQAIYGFRGASARFMQIFQEDFPQARVFYLTRNFRTPASLLTLATNLIRRNRRRFQKPLEASVDLPEAYGLYAAEDEEAEARFVAQKIREFLKDRYVPQEIAVMARIRARLHPVERELRRQEIPYNLVGEGGWLGHPLAQALVAFLRLAEGEATREEARAVLETLLQMPSTTATRLLRGYTKRRKFSHPRDLSPQERHRLEQLEQQIQRYREHPEQFAPVDLLQGVLALRPELADEPRALAERDAAESVLQVAAGFGRGGVPDFLQYLRLLQNLEVPPRPTGVQVLTVHAAKGLEFPIVFIVGLEQEVFPLRGSLMKVAALEEERRLLYVAMTRAQERLFLSYAKQYKKQPQQPSPFLHELLIQRE